MNESFSGSADEARFLLKLVRAYQGAQETIFHIGVLLDEFGLRRNNYDLNNDRMLEIAKSMAEQEQSDEQG